MCVIAGFEDNIHFYDFMIDWYYAHFTELNKKPCKKVLKPEDLIHFFQSLALKLFPFEDDQTAYGHLL